MWGEIYIIIIRYVWFLLKWGKWCGLDIRIIDVILRLKKKCF